MSDLVINVKQISNYPARGSSDGTETILLQTQGLGGPYQSIASATLVGTALASSGVPLGVGLTPPSDTAGAATFTANDVHELNGAVFFNCYWTGQTIKSLQGGFAGRYAVDQGSGDYIWEIGAGVVGQPVTLSTAMQLTQAGALSLPYGTLTVARDPATPFEVATANWVSNNTVASFNSRIGQVQLTASDVYQALGYTDYIATQPWVISAINASIGNLITTYPLVTTWNGRTGDILLTLSDITCVFFQPGQQPISPTPPLTSNDNSIATTQWVTTFITNELSGSGQTLATQPWVLANTVNSFNARTGPVTLTASDVFDVGAAPLNSPAFSGIPNAPTANPGTSTAQLATTAFVQAAVAGSVSGVASFNTRTGAVVLTNADVTGAGGLANPNANLTGNPTAPTAAPGTSTTQIATTQFVAAALSTGAVQSFNTRTGAVTLQLADVTGVGGAPTASPTFTGTPAAPTASPGTNTTQLATTQFVTAALTAAGGVSSFNSRTGAVTLQANDISAVGGLINPSVNLTGVPTAPTAAPATNTTQIATTAYVQAALTAGAVTSFNTRTGAITLTGTDITNAGGALLASPTFTGTPQAPTATAGTNNTQLATTAFVAAAISAGTAGVTSFNTRTGAVTLLLADVTGVGGAPIAAPAFTGVPTAPTATAGTSTTQLATTQFVQSAVSAGAVTSFNTRTGAVTLQANDISAATGALIASPTFTGTPAAPTATAGTNTTQLATTQFVTTAVAPAVQAGNDNVGRNVVMNGTFIIQQRGAGPFTAGGYCLDRWALGFTGGTSSVTPATLADADRTAIGNEAALYAMQNVMTGVSTAGSFNYLEQYIEGVHGLSNKTVTVSFWAKAATGTPKIGVSIDQYFGSGGSPSAQVNGTGQAVTISTTWARYNLTFTIPSTTGKTLGTDQGDATVLNLWFSSGSTNNTRAGGIGVQSGTFSVYGVQVEVGSVATVLDAGGTAQQILANCMRFYQGGYVTLFGYSLSGASFAYNKTLIVPMRAPPTISQLSGVSALQISNTDFIAQISPLPGVTGSTTFNSFYAASADL